MPGLVEGHPPVDADHRAPAPGHGAQQLAGAHPEQDGGDAGVARGQLGEDAPGGRQDQLAVVGRRQDAGPAVEQLDGGGPGIQLGAQRGQGQVAEPLHQLVPQPRVAVHEGLDPGEVLGRAALHEVAGHGERPAGEADQGDRQLGGQLPHGVDHIGRVDLGFEWAQPLQVPAVREGLGHDRPGARGHVHAEADGRHRDHDVGEEDGGVGPVAVHRLVGQTGHQFGPGDGLEDAARTPSRPVLGQGPAGLSHEPHRDTVHREAATGADERRVVEAGGPRAAHAQRPDALSGRSGGPGPPPVGSGRPPPGEAVVLPRCRPCAESRRWPILPSGRARGHWARGPVTGRACQAYNRGFP